MCNFIEKRLDQLAPIGASVGTRAFGKTLVWVSTIKFGDGLWTKVEDEERKIRRYYQGDVDTDIAAGLFRHSIGG